MVLELISTNFFTMNVPHMSHQVLGTLEDLVAVEALVRSSSAARLLHSMASELGRNGSLCEPLHHLQELEQRRLWVELADPIHRLVQGLLELLGASFEELDDLVGVQLPAQLWWMLQVPEASHCPCLPLLGPSKLHKAIESQQIQHENVTHM